MSLGKYLLCAELINAGLNLEGGDRDDEGKWIKEGTLLHKVIYSEEYADARFHATAVGASVISVAFLFLTNRPMEAGKGAVKRVS